jgi:hypothetical protein
MTPLLIGIVLIVGGVAFAAAPFLRRSRGDAPAPDVGDRSTSPSDQGPLERQDAATSPTTDTRLADALEELELDLAMGKMGEADYRRLRSALERRALTATAATEREAVRAAAELAASELAASDTAESTVDRAGFERAADGPVAEAASLSSAPFASPLTVDRAAIEREAEARIAAERAHVVTCPDCGPRPEPAAPFCSNCGRALGACPDCGAAIQQSDANFCDRCGTTLKAE